MLLKVSAVNSVMLLFLLFVNEWLHFFFLLNEFLGVFVASLPNRSSFY